MGRYNYLELIVCLKVFGYIVTKESFFLLYFGFIFRLLIGTVYSG